MSYTSIKLNVRGRGAVWTGISCSHESSIVASRVKNVLQKKVNIIEEKIVKKIFWHSIPDGS